VGPNGEQYTPINQVFKDAGKKTGLVTTTRITHATPAAFSVNIANRSEEDRIAELYLQREYDLLMGGGSRHFSPKRRNDGQDLFQKFTDKDYHIARDKKQLREAPADRRLLGLFHDDHMPYSIDHRAIEQYRNSIPTLAEMTEKALRHMDNKGGFLLQVEGGRVDHGAHQNDATAMLYDQIAFDDAIKVALDFVDQRDDTLLIITTDHGNGNPGLNGAGPRYKDTNKRFNNMQRMRHSNTWALSKLNGNSSISDIQDRVKQATRIGISKEEATALKKSFNDNLDTLYELQKASDSVLGSILANYTAINFTSGNHTSDYIELAALGPGSDNLDYFTRNTELFDFVLKSAGISDKATPAKTESNY
jgi:alkaline phosphatase